MVFLITWQAGGLAKMNCVLCKIKKIGSKQEKHWKNDTKEYMLNLFIWLASLINEGRKKLDTFIWIANKL